MKENAGSFFTTYLPLTLLQGFERVVEGLHVRGCWWPNVNFIFWPHCYDRYVVSFLFSWCWGLLHRGFPHLVSNPLGVCWQLLWGFPRSPSVGCGLPYHISSLTLWESAGNCFGGFRGPPRSGVTFPTTSRLYCLEFYWQLLWGFPRSPSVGCGLPYHISSLLSGILLTTGLGPKLNWVK